MPDLHKTLIVAHVRPRTPPSREEEVRREDGAAAASCAPSGYVVDELAFTSEHAPFRHKNTPKGVGTQIKPH